MTRAEDGARHGVARVDALGWRRVTGVGAVVLSLAVLSLAGCAKAPTPTPASSSSQPASRPSGSASAVPAMTPAEKRSQIATSFPVEVPVAAGKIVRGEAQGDSAWDYEVVVGAKSADVSAFYRAAYLGANWQVASEAQVGEDGHRFAFMKGGAQSEVTVEPQESDTTLVTVTLGLGVGVLQTQ